MIVLATLALEPGRLTNDAAMFDKHNYPVKATTRLTFGKRSMLIFCNKFGVELDKSGYAMCVERYSKTPKNFCNREPKPDANPVVAQFLT